VAVPIKASFQTESGLAPECDPAPTMVSTRADAQDAGDRLSGVDLVRLAAVSAIVWFHIQAPGREFAYAGLPVLLVLSVAMPVFQSRGRSLAEDAVRRGVRLIRPWAFWSAFYGVWIVGRASYRGQPLFANFDPNWLLIGSALHLWYLPFAYLATLAALALERALSGRTGATACAVGAVLGGATVLVASVILGVQPIPAPYTQWLFSLAAIPYGLAIGEVLRRVTPEHRSRALAWIAASAVAAALALNALGNRDAAIAYGIGIPIACLAVLWKPRLNALGHALVVLPMGIYLLHPFVYQRLYHFGLASMGNVSTALAVIALSGALTLALRHTPLRTVL
jgi:surface polysaccharide O-acyltransferase-like enzyme